MGDGVKKKKVLFIVDCHEKELTNLKARSLGQTNTQGVDCWRLCMLLL